MKKIIIILILLIPLNIYAEEINLLTDKYIVYDETSDKVRLSSNENEKVKIASITKIATTLAAIEENVNLDEKVKYTYEIQNMIPSEAYVFGMKVGNEYTYRDLLYITLLSSGADAATTLAYYSSGSVDNHIQKMNELSKKVGLNDTYYTNVIGLDTNNPYSTANEQLTLLKYALENPTFKEIFETKEYIASSGDKVQSSTAKYAETINLDTSRIIGSKTGYTGLAGLCLIGEFQSNNHNYYFVILNDPISNNYDHIRDALKLVDYYDNNYKDVTILKKNDYILDIPIINSKQTIYKATSPKEITYYTNINSFDKELVKYKSNIKEISYKNKINTKIGNIDILYNDELIEKVDITLNEELKPNIQSFIKDNILFFITPIILLIVVIIVILSKKKKVLN